MVKSLKNKKETDTKRKIATAVMKEWEIEMSENLLDAIIHDEQRLKMFKEMGYV